MVDPFKISFVVYQHLKDMEKEIEQEFIETLRNNIINPYDENVILLGNNYAFVYAGVIRYKHVIQFKFLIFRRHEIRDLYRNYRRILGKIYVNVRIGGDDNGQR